MFLVVDFNKDIHEIYNYKGLRDLLVEEVVQDILCNHNCYDDVKNGVRVFEKLIKEETTIIKELENRMWKVVDLEQLERDIYDLNEYFNDNGSRNKLQESVNIIDDLLNKGGI